MGALQHRSNRLTETWYKNVERFGRIRRIHLRVHYSWIAVVIFMIIAVVTQFSTTFSLPNKILLGLLASLLFFGSIMVREFFLILMADRKGAYVKSVTVFAIGEILQIERAIISPALESLLATLGMLTNLVIAGILLVLYQVLAHTGIVMVHVVIEWLAFIWFMLTIFNIIPGFPLDGGKLLRAFLWKTTGKYEQVTRIISWVSWGIGIAIAIGGIVLFITTQQWFAAVLLILPGFIMQNAATQSRRHLG